MAAGYKASDKAYIVESNRIVRKCTVVRPTRNLFIIRFENGGGIRVNKNRLFATKEAAEESIPKAKPKPVVAQQRGYRSPYDYWH